MEKSNVGKNCLQTIIIELSRYSVTQDGCRTKVRYVIMKYEMSMISCLQCESNAKYLLRACIMAYEILDSFCLIQAFPISKKGLLCNRGGEFGPGKSTADGNIASKASSLCLKNSSGETWSPICKVFTRCFAASRAFMPIICRQKLLQ